MPGTPNITIRLRADPDRIRITAAGRSALTQQASLSYRDKRRWNAVDTTMSYVRWFDTRDAAGKALHRRFTKMMQGGRL
jgi:hypothetical protein